MTASLDAGGPGGFHLFHLGLLIWRQDLKHLAVNARSLYGQLALNLRLLRGQSANFRFIVGTLFVLMQLLFALPELGK